MSRISVIPIGGTNLYGLLTKKEVALRKKNQGTLHRSGSKKAGVAKWTHSTYKGWITMQKCVGGTVAATLQSRVRQDEWQLLSSFLGFLDRHFRDCIASITISYDQSGE